MKRKVCNLSSRVGCFAFLFISVVCLTFVYESTTTAIPNCTLNQISKAKLSRLVFLDNNSRQSYVGDVLVGNVSHSSYVYPATTSNETVINFSSSKIAVNSTSLPSIEIVMAMSMDLKRTRRGATVATKDKGAWLGHHDVSDSPINIYLTDFVWNQNEIEAIDSSLRAKTPYNNIKSSVRTPNFVETRGHECQVYIDYILDNYSELPDYIFFVHGNDGYLKKGGGGPLTGAHNYNLLGVMRALANDIRSGKRNVTFYQFNHLTRYNLKTSLINSWAKKVGMSEDVCNWLFELLQIDLKTGDFYTGNCCAQFMVSKDRILQHPRSWYKLIYKKLAEEVDLCYCLEHKWHILFGLPRHLPVENRYVHLEPSTGVLDPPMCVELERNRTQTIENSHEYKEVGHGPGSQDDTKRSPAPLFATAKFDESMLESLDSSILLSKPTKRAAIEPRTQRRRGQKRRRR